MLRPHIAVEAPWTETGAIARRLLDRAYPGKAVLGADRCDWRNAIMMGGLLAPMSGAIPEYLALMVRRPTPATAVIPGTTPVISFGDPRRAEIASLGINPSWQEFSKTDGSLLAGRTRRLSTLASLGAENTAALADDQVQTIVAECAAYFSGNPYRRWFDPFDQVLRDGVGASYYDGSACHLDLVQWATAPKWGDLLPGIRRSLLEESLPYLQDQLRFGNLRLVILNGREVLDQVRNIGLAKLETCGKLTVNERLSCSLYSGLGEDVKFLGWSTNLQSSRGVTREFKAGLVRWLSDAASRAEARVWKRDGSMSESAKAFDVNGYVVKGTEVASKFELLKLLQAWLEASDVATISGVRPGRTPIILMPLDHGRRVELNADTKRSAIEGYLKVARAHRGDLPWYVIRNRDGTCNKLVFRPDRQPTPGWYCYLRPAAVGPEVV